MEFREIMQSVLLNILFQLILADIPFFGSNFKCWAEGNGNLLQCSCLENLMDRGAWWATVHGVPKVRHDWVTNTLSDVEVVLVTPQDFFHVKMTITGLYDLWIGTESYHDGKTIVIIWRSHDWEFLVLIYVVWCSFVPCVTGSCSD